MFRRLLWWSTCLSVLAIVACAPKAPPAVVGAPKHPDFMFPVAPEGTAAAQSARLDRGWQYLQLDDTRNAEREFAAALKQQAAFHPADAALAYVSLARGNDAEALTRFDRALAGDAGYVPALVGRGQALLELARVGDALVSFEAALAELEGIVKDLEGGKGKLEEAVAAYERGAALRRHCDCFVEILIQLLDRFRAVPLAQLLTGAVTRAAISGW